MIEEIISRYGTPLYIYQEEKIIENYNLINSAIPYPKKQIHFAVMSNNNPEILKILRKLGSSAQVNSLYEVEKALLAGFSESQINYTSTGIDTKTMKKLREKQIQLNLDSVEEVEKFCPINPGGKFGIRIKMDESITIPENCTNSPKDSDIGISKQDFEKVKRAAQKHSCSINGIHGYLASNILDTEPFIQSSNYLINCAKNFPELEYVNFGSGFGVPGKKSDKDFDFKKIGKQYTRLTEHLNNFFGRQLELKVEPGRSIMATAGKLYAQVTNIKNLETKKQIAINAGFAEFARPRIYNAYHEIELLGKESQEKEVYDIRANTVLQSDFLGRNRTLPKIQEGDILVIKNTGAYGIVMYSGFPGKTKPSEVVIYIDGRYEKTELA